ncbi:MAG: ACP S-malonyltransferase, partial [Lentisphaeria bacterium]|nr:ACP S-malonyltransferase [Lentisphaeria bacterium]
ALETFKEKFPGIEPVGCAGLSLGEYGALYAAGAFDFVTGLKLLAKRAELMDEACNATCGGMASILNGDLEIIREVCNECGIDVANFNSPAQIVISGEKEKVSAACAKLKERGIRKAIELNVAGAFHSRLMAEAGEKLKAVLAETEINMPAVPAYHNCTAAPAADIGELKAALASQVASSVRWHECVLAMVAAGGDTMIEFGPGNVLTKLCSRALPEVTTFNVNSAAALDALNF